MTTKINKGKNRNYFNKKYSFVSILLIFMVALIYILYPTKNKNIDRLCADDEVGISLILPEGWSCHSSEQEGFYIEPSWVELKPNTGSSRQFTIWFKNKTNYNDIKIDSRFCHPNEYSMNSTTCPESVYYSYNGFDIKERTNKKKLEYGVTTSYVGIYKDFLEVQFNPSSSGFELNSGYKENLDNIFDSIRKI